MNMLRGYLRGLFAITHCLSVAVPRPWRHFCINNLYATRFNLQFTLSLLTIDGSIERGDSGRPDNLRMHWRIAPGQVCSFCRHVGI